MDAAKKVAFDEALAAVGLVKAEGKKTVEDMTPDEYASEVARYVGLLAQAHELKNEKLAKKLRRILRNRFEYKVSEHKKVTIG